MPLGFPSYLFVQVSIRISPSFVQGFYLTLVGSTFLNTTTWLLKKWKIKDDDQINVKKKYIYGYKSIGYGFFHFLSSQYTTKKSHILR